jgi:hypothetical protein
VSDGGVSVVRGDSTRQPISPPVPQSDADPVPDFGADLLHAYLAGRDAPCPNCEYNLRDLAGDRCPECGLELVLRVSLSEPKLGAFLAGLVGLSAGAGFSGLVLLYWFIVTFFIRQGGGNEVRLLTIVISGLVVESAALLGWLKFRGRLRTLTPQSRWVLALACWGLTLVNLLWFSLFIR